MFTRYKQMFLCAAVFLVAANQMYADLIVTPDYSRVSSFAQIEEGAINDVDDQTATLDSLSTSASTALNEMTLSNNAVANWNGPGSGSVSLDYVRLNGQNFFFSGESRFLFDFTVSEATELTIDYAFEGTSSYNSSSGSANWWGMQGYQIIVDGESSSFNFLDAGRAPNNLPSPIQFIGQLEFTLDPGAHQLELTLHGGSVGDFPGNRTMIGGIDFQIGASTVPEPSFVSIFGFSVIGFFSVRLRNRES